MPRQRALPELPSDSAHILSEQALKVAEGTTTLGCLIRVPICSRHDRIICTQWMVLDLTPVDLTDLKE